MTVTDDDTPPAPSSDLADLVNFYMSLRGLTLREVEARSLDNPHGEHITYGYACKIKNGHTRRPGRDKLLALADALEAPYDDVLRAAGYQVGPPSPEPPDGAVPFHKVLDSRSELSEPARRVIHAVYRSVTEHLPAGDA